MRPSRRDVLRLAGAGTTGWLLGCGDDDARRGELGDGYASAVLEPDASSMLVTLWSSAARSATVEVEDASSVVFRGSVELDAAGRAVADVGGLAAATDHRVTIIANSGARLVHEVRTAPHDDDPRPVRIAIGADLDPSPEFDSDLLVQLAAANPELFISLGDFPYTDNGPVATTVDAYRQRHVELRTTPKVRAWLGSVGVRAIYDDHEFRNDWDAMFAALEAQRYAAAMQVWDEFFPTRGSGDVRYRAWRWGRHLECFLLDTRRFRSANAAPDDANKTMLGALQRDWLIDGVRRSPATFKLILTSVPLDFGDGGDHWPSFSSERTRVFDALAGVPGVLFVSADQHWFAAQRHARGIREFQVGPLARGLGVPRGGPGVLFTSARYNAGLVDIDGDALTFSGVGAGGEVFYQETLRAADLTPSA